MGTQIIGTIANLRSQGYNEIEDTRQIIASLHQGIKLEDGDYNNEWGSALEVDLRDHLSFICTILILRILIVVN